MQVLKQTIGIITISALLMAAAGYSHADDTEAVRKCTADWRAINERKQRHEYTSSLERIFDRECRNVLSQETLLAVQQEAETKGDTRTPADRRRDLRKARDNMGTTGFSYQVRSNCRTTGRGRNTSRTCTTSVTGPIY